MDEWTNEQQRTKIVSFLYNCSIFIYVTCLGYLEPKSWTDFPYATWTGHEDDYVIELANEVRKVLDVVKSATKEKNLVAAPHVVKDHIPSLQLLPRQETVVLDSW